MASISSSRLPQKREVGEGGDGQEVFGEGIEEWMGGLENDMDGVSNKHALQSCDVWCQ